MERMRILSLLAAGGILLSGEGCALANAASEALFTRQNSVKRHIAEEMMVAQDKGDEPAFERLAEAEEKLNDACEPLQRAGFLKIELLDHLINFWLRLLVLFSHAPCEERIQEVEGEVQNGQSGAKDAPR